MRSRLFALGFSFLTLVALASVPFSTVACGSGVCSAEADKACRNTHTACVPALRRRHEDRREWPPRVRSGLPSLRQEMRRRPVRMFQRVRDPLLATGLCRANLTGYVLSALPGLRFDGLAERVGVVRV